MPKHDEAISALLANAMAGAELQAERGEPVDDREFVQQFIERMDQTKGTIGQLAMQHRTNHGCDTPISELIDALKADPAMLPVGQLIRLGDCLKAMHFTEGKPNAK